MKTKTRQAEQHHPAAIGLIVRGDEDEYHRRIYLARSKCLELFREARRRGLGRLDALAEATAPLWCECYGGPGRQFRHRPVRIRNGRRWIVWAQRGGYDI
jgi:hypothetical protein